MELLESLILDSSIELFERYRVIYFIRNIGNSEFIKIFNSVLDKKNREKTNVLMRHEVCFIIG